MILILDAWALPDVDDVLLDRGMDLDYIQSILNIRTSA